MDLSSVTLTVPVQCRDPASHSSGPCSRTVYGANPTLSAPIEAKPSPLAGPLKSFCMGGNAIAKANQPEKETIFCIFDRIGRLAN